MEKVINEELMLKLKDNIKDNAEKESTKEQSEKENIKQAYIETIAGI